MSRYQSLSTAFVERLDAAVASVRDDDYEYVDVQPLVDALMATCEAHEAGRPYSYFNNPLRPPQPPDPDPTSPGARLLEQMLELRRRMESQPEWADEQAERERRQARMLVLIRRDERRRAERAQRQRIAPVQDATLAEVALVASSGAARTTGL